MSPRRQWLATVLVCAAGAAATLVAAGRSWADEVVARPAPLADQRVVHSGGELLPWLPALAWVALAGAGALVATRGRARRAVGALLVLVGAVMAAGAGWGAAQPAAALAWPVLGVAGAVAVAAAGTLAVARGRRWPVLGARYERPAHRPPVADRLWDALDRGEDPTA